MDSVVDLGSVENLIPLYRYYPKIQIKKSFPEYGIGLWSPIGFRLEKMEELVLKYVRVGNEIEPNGYIVEDYLFSENYLISDIFFTEDTLYTILWDCRICTDSYLILKDAPENRANPYIVAIPLYEFKSKSNY